MWGDHNCSHLLIALTLCWASFPTTVPVYCLHRTLITNRKLSYVFANWFIICSPQPHSHLPSPHLQTGYVKSVRLGTLSVFFSSVSPVPRTTAYTSDDFNRYTASKKVIILYMLCNFLCHIIMVRDTFVLMHCDLFYAFKWMHSIP